jgi:hypothetical protein
MNEQYQTIARALSEEIAGGRYSAETPLPCRTELARQFKVARATVDRSIRLLVKKGVLTSRRGAGTFIAQNEQRHSIVFVGLPQRDDRIPPCPPHRLSYLPFDACATRSARRRLEEFDGIVWNMPDFGRIEWMREFQGRVPQIVINRHLPEFNYVSTDHKGAIQSVTSQRLAQLPDAVPLFLTTHSPENRDIVQQMRMDGFVAACRDAGRFYEIVVLPGEFEQKKNVLAERAKPHAGKMLLLVSSALANTGAVVSWVGEQKLRWGEEIFYSDFDNNYPENVFGFQVTSFLQDFPLLITEGVKRLVELIEKKRESAQVLIPPKRVDGRT